MKVNIQARDSEVRVPQTRHSLFYLKNQYIINGLLENESAEELFDMVDFLVDRLLQAESERFRNNY